MVVSSHGVLLRLSTHWDFVACAVTWPKQDDTCPVRSARVARLNTSKFSPTRSVAPRRFPARPAPHHHRAKTAPPRRLDTSIASGRLESPSTKGAARAKVSHGTPTMWSLASSVTRVGTVVASGRAAARRRAQAVAAGARCISVASATDVFLSKSTKLGPPKPDTSWCFRRAKVRPRLFSHTVPGWKSGNGDSRNRLVYQGVDVPTPGVDSRDRTVYPGVDGPIPRVDSRDRPVYQGVNGPTHGVDFRDRTVYPGVNEPTAGVDRRFVGAT